MQAFPTGKRKRTRKRQMPSDRTLIEMLQVDKGALQKEISTLKGIIGQLRRKVEVAQLIDESASLPPLLENERTTSHAVNIPLKSRELPR